MSRALHQELEGLARQWAPLEVGGVLAGYWSDDQAVVTHCIGPGTNAEHQAYTFVPDYAFHEREIARLYESTNGATIYLGDWHSHPSGEPLLSTVDKRTLRGIAESAEARCPRPLMVLLASSAGEWSARGFTLGPERRLLPRKILGVNIRVY